MHLVVKSKQCITVTRGDDIDVAADDVSEVTFLSCLLPLSRSSHRLTAPVGMMGAEISEMPLHCPLTATSQSDHQVELWRPRNSSLSLPPNAPERNIIFLFAEEMKGESFFVLKRAMTATWSSSIAVFLFSFPCE